MATLNKKMKSLIAAGIAVVLLGGALTTVLLLPNGDTDTTSSGTTSSSTAITLVEQKQEDVKNVNIKNADGSYDIALTGDKKWEIASLNGFAQFESTYSSVTSAVATVTASKLLFEEQENLKEYGLETPSIVVTVTYKNGSTFQMNLGDESPEGGVYMTVTGKDPIYIYSGDSSYFELTPLDFLDTTVIDEIDTTTSSTSSDGTSSSTTETIVLDRLEIQRPDLEKPIILEKNPEDPEDSMTYNTYIMTSPVEIAGNDETLGDTMTTGFFGMVATSVEVLNPTAAQKKERGFDQPEAVVKVTYDGESYTLRIGKAITCEATDDLNDLESGHTHVTTGYNVMLDGKNIIYNVYPDSLPWLTCTVEDIANSFVVMPYILDVKRVTVSFDGKTHVFDLTHTKDEEDYDVTAIKYNNRSLTEDYFKGYYQLLLSITQTGLNTQAVSGSLVMTLQYDYIDSSKASDKLEFFDDGKGGIIIRCNGKADFLTKYSIINRIKENTALIIQNKEVDPN